jgi:hypothetical protein
VEAHPREIVSRVIVDLHALVIFGAVVVDGGRLPASQPEERQYPPRGRLPHRLRLEVGKLRKVRDCPKEK